MKIIENSYENDTRLKIQGSRKNPFFGKPDLNIFDLQFVAIIHCKKKVKRNLKGKDLTNFEKKSMIGKLKIHNEDYRYEINEMNEIFVTENEYSISKIQHQFTIEKVYFVNPKLLLANLDYLQKGKNFKTKFPPPFIFENHLGKYIPISISFTQKVKYAQSTETLVIEKCKPSSIPRNSNGGNIYSWKQRKN